MAAVETVFGVSSFPTSDGAQTDSASSDRDDAFRWGDGNRGHAQADDPFSHTSDFPAGTSEEANLDTQSSPEAPPSAAAAAFALLMSSGHTRPTPSPSPSANGHAREPAGAGTSPDCGWLAQGDTNCLLVSTAEHVQGDPSGGDAAAAAAAAVVAEESHWSWHTDDHEAPGDGFVTLTSDGSGSIPLPFFMEDRAGISRSPISPKKAKTPRRNSRRNSLDSPAGAQGEYLGKPPRRSDVVLEIRPSMILRESLDVLMTEAPEEAHHAGALLPVPPSEEAAAPAAAEDPTPQQSARELEAAEEPMLQEPTGRTADAAEPGAVLAAVFEAEARTLSARLEDMPAADFSPGGGGGCGGGGRTTCREEQRPSAAEAPGVVLAAVFNAEARSLSAALEEMPAADFVTLSNSPTAQPAPSDPAISGSSPRLADTGEWEEADRRATEWEPFQSSVRSARLDEAAAADAGAAGSPAAAGSPDTVASEHTGSSLLDFEALEAGIEANPFVDLSPTKGAAATAAEAAAAAAAAVAEEEVDIELLLGGSAAVMASLEEVDDGWTAGAAAAEAPSSSEKDAKLRRHRQRGGGESIDDWSSGSSGGGGGGGGAATWAALDYTGIAARAAEGSDAPFVWRTNPVAAEEEVNGEEPSALTYDMLSRMTDDVCAGDIMSMSPRLISLEVRAIPDSAMLSHASASFRCCAGPNAAV